MTRFRCQYRPRSLILKREFDTSMLRRRGSILQMQAVQKTSFDVSLRFIRTAFLLLCLQQISLTVCATAALTNPNPSLSGSVHRRASSPAFSPPPDSRGRVLPLNSSTASNNPTNGTLPAENRNAYCRDDINWYGPSWDLNIEDCHKAILSLRNDLPPNTDISTRFTWSFPGFDSRSHKFTPRSYVSNNCVLSVWPRYLAAEGDNEIREAQPKGLRPSDEASFKDIGTLAFQVYDQCLLRRVPATAGWIPAGERSSLFVGFWGRHSEWDDWEEDLQLGSLPERNVSVATT